jgi:hypothetical protein
MNAMKLIGALAAAGTLAIVSSRAEALVCYSPAPGLFSDIVNVFVGGKIQQLVLTCNSQPTGGTRTKVTGNGHRTIPNHVVVADLTAGPAGSYARVGAYGTNRAGLGCFAIDTNTSQGFVSTSACSATVGFIDMEIGN